MGVLRRRDDARRLVHQMDLQRLGAKRPAVERHPARLVYVAGRVHHDLPSHAHPPLADEPLGGAPRSHAGMGQEFRQAHPDQAATLAVVDLALLDKRLEDSGEPRFRARQVWEWTARGAAAYDEMTNLPVGLRERLAEQVPFS